MDLGWPIILVFFIANRSFVNFFFDSKKALSASFGLILNKKLTLKSLVLKFNSGQFFSRQ